MYWISADNRRAVRDFVSGLVVLLLAHHDPRLLAAMLLVSTPTPFADALIVLRHHGPKVIAYSVHAATGAVALITAALLMA